MGPRVTLASGATIAAALPAAAAVGDAITVTVRPEDVRLSAEPPTGPCNVLRGTVTAQMFLGNVIDYHVDVGGATLRALAPRHETVPTGAQVYLWIEPGRCVGMAS